MKLKDSCKYRIRETQIDIFGHVNNSEYLTIFEEARWDLITKHGYGQDKVIKTQKGPVILECKVRYRRELTARQEITIETELIGVDDTIMTIEQKMLNESGELLSDIVLKCGFMDLKTRKLIRPVPQWLDY